MKKSKKYKLQSTSAPNVHENKIPPPPHQRRAPEHGYSWSKKDQQIFNKMHNSIITCPKKLQRFLFRI